MDTTETIDETIFRLAAARGHGKDDALTIDQIKGVLSDLPIIQEGRARGIDRIPYDDVLSMAQSAKRTAKNEAFISYIVGHPFDRVLVVTLPQNVTGGDAFVISEPTPSARETPSGILKQMAATREMEIPGWFPKRYKVPSARVAKRKTTMVAIERLANRPFWGTSDETDQYFPVPGDGPVDIATPPDEETVRADVEISVEADGREERFVFPGAGRIRSLDPSAPYRDGQVVLRVIQGRPTVLAGTTVKQTHPVFYLDAYTTDPTPGATVVIDIGGSFHYGEFVFRPLGRAGSVRIRTPPDLSGGLAFAGRASKWLLKTRGFAEFARTSSAKIFGTKTTGVSEVALGGVLSAIAYAAEKMENAVLSIAGGGEAEFPAGCHRKSR